jgi:hypothetical protein
MPDQIRRDKTYPYAVLPTTQARPIIYFNDLESALKLYPKNEIYEVWESRNATGGSGDEDGFTQWRESFEPLAENST